MLLPLRIFVAVPILALFPLFICAQGAPAPSSSPAEAVQAYQNSADGLRMQLQDILAVAREHNGSQLKSLIRQMEIPNYEDWFRNTYGEEKGDRLAGAYERNLANSESDLESIFTQLAGEDGEFTLRKTGDAQTSGRAPAVNAPALKGLQDAADPFFASWNSQEPSAPNRIHPIGTFVYFSGSYRLLRAFRGMAIRPMIGSGPAPPRGAWSATGGSAPDHLPDSRPATGPVQPEVRIASLPSCDYCPSAEYSEAARKKGLEGTVVLQAIVQPDGTATDIQVVNSPDPELTQMAMNSMGRWRFKPARNADGEPVAYREAVEVGLHLAK
jgi:TonB family protein